MPSAVGSAPELRVQARAPDTHLSGSIILCATCFPLKSGGSVSRTEGSVGGGKAGLAGGGARARGRRVAGQRGFALRGSVAGSLLQLRHDGGAVQRLAAQRRGEVSQVLPSIRSVYPVTSHARSDDSAGPLTALLGRPPDCFEMEGVPVVF